MNEEIKEVGSVNGNAVSVDSKTKSGDMCLELNKIYLGDCMELVKKIDDHSIDLVLTDPPYNISKKNNFESMGLPSIDFGEWDKGFDLFGYIKELPRILKKDASVIIFNDWKNLGDIAKCCEDNGMAVKNMLRWEKANPMPRNRDRLYITDCEYSVWCVNGNAKWIFNRQSNGYERPCFKSPLTSSREKTGHPTQKPVALFENLLKLHSRKGDVILDLFAGSGAVAVACIENERDFICFEKDGNYYRAAKERIDNAMLKNIHRFGNFDLDMDSSLKDPCFNHSLRLLLHMGKAS